MCWQELNYMTSLLTKIVANEINVLKSGNFPFKCIVSVVIEFFIFGKAN